MNHSLEINGRSRGFLVGLLAWHLLKLVLIVGGGIAVIVAIIAVVGVPVFLVGLGALLVFPRASIERKRAFAIAWW